jgi:hypothetical protein
MIVLRLKVPVRLQVGPVHKYRPYNAQVSQHTVEVAWTIIEGQDIGIPHHDIFLLSKHVRQDVGGKSTK